MDDEIIIDGDNVLIIDKSQTDPSGEYLKVEMKLEDYNKYYVNSD